MLRRFAAVVVMLVLAILGLVPAAQAQTYIAVSYWPASMNVESGLGTWTTGFIVLDYSGVFRPPFGLRFTYASGAQGNWGGPGWAGLTDAGTDTIWSVDLFWQRSTGNAVLRPFVGWGSMQYSTDFSLIASGTETFQISGFRVGAEMVIMSTGPVRFFGAIAYYPSVSQHFVDDTGAITDASGAGTAFDYVIGAKFLPPGRNFGISAGWRGTSYTSNGCAGCIASVGYGWSGWFIGVSFHP